MSLSRQRWILLTFTTNLDLKKKNKQKKISTSSNYKTQRKGRCPCYWLFQERNKERKNFPTHESNLTSFFGSVHALCSCLCAWHLEELYYLQPQYIQSSCSTATNTINITSLDQEKSELSAQTSNHIYSSGDTGQPESAKKDCLWTVWDHRVLAAIKAHCFACTF